jgi:hypothetical protein
MKWFLIFFSIGYLSCSEVKTNDVDNNTVDNKTDTMEIIRQFIYGLWSMDSGNILMNEGYNFKSDGSVDFIAAEASGKWQLVSKDSIKIEYHSFDQDIIPISKIDSLSNDRMVLNDSDRITVLRKVPYGENYQGNVIQGFAGTLEKGDERQYSFNVPSIKKIQLKLNSSNPDIFFNVFDDKKKITDIPVREWTAILIKGGEYQIVVSLPKKSTSLIEGKFDLKVIAF